VPSAQASIVSITSATITARGRLRGHQRVGDENDRAGAAHLYVNRLLRFLRPEEEGGNDRQHRALQERLSITQRLRTPVAGLRRVRFVEQDLVQEIRPHPQVHRPTAIGAHAYPEPVRGIAEAFDHRECTGLEGCTLYVVDLQCSGLVGEPLDPEDVITFGVHRE
jgi:hypothetical protein